MKSESIILLSFIAFVFLMLAVDLGLFSKSDKPISTKRALIMSSIWLLFAICFYFTIYNYGHYLHHITSFKELQTINAVYFHHLQLNPNNYLSSLQIYRTNLALEFITGYTVEYALSVDNIFVIVLIFSAFAVEPKNYHKVLFWGIIGAVIFRGLMIFFGVILIRQIDWITYLFGGFLVFTAIKMLFKKEEDEFNPKESFVYKMIGKVIPITHHKDKEHFFIKENNRNYATPLFVTLIVIEVMDMVFAMDSVPAILAITSDPFLVFSSNIFAILGLRSMYFFLANMLEKFSYLEYSLIAILIFVGIKMLIIHYYKFPEWVSLSFIAVSLLTGIVVSLKMAEKD